MARKGNPVSLRLSVNRSPDSSWFSDLNYGKSVYQDVNLRSYFNSRRPPTRLTFGFRLGRLIVLHFPKRKCISFFYPRLSQELKWEEEDESEKGCWELKEVEPIRGLHSSDGTEKERKAVRGAGKRVESSLLEDQEKIRISTISRKKQGYDDRSASIKKKLSKLFSVCEDTGVVNYIAKAKARKDFQETKLFDFFFPLQSRSNSLTSHLLKRTLPAVRPSLNYAIMQYLLKTKKKMNFNPVGVLQHFVAPGVAEPSTMGGTNAQGSSSLYKRISLITAFLLIFLRVESSTSTSEKKSLTEAKKRLTHCIRQAHYLLFAERTKTTTSFFPFFGATFFFLRDSVNKSLFFENERKECIDKFRRKSWNLIRKDKTMEFLTKFIDLGEMGEFRKAIHILIFITMRNRRGINPYLMQEERQMHSFLSNRTKSYTFIKSLRVKHVYQSASMIAQEIAFQLKKKGRSFRFIFNNILTDIDLLMKKRVEGIRICCSGRSEGAEIARTECGKYGKTSCNIFYQKMDYAPAEVSTRYGISGVKVWISYRKKPRTKVN